MFVLVLPTVETAERAEEVNQADAFLRSLRAPRLKLLPPHSYRRELTARSGPRIRAEMKQTNGGVRSRRSLDRTNRERMSGSVDMQGCLCDEISPLRHPHVGTEVVV